MNFWGGKEKARQESKALLATLKPTSKTGSPAISLAQVKRIGYDKFDAVFIPGGHIPMQDLLKDRNLGELLTDLQLRRRQAQVSIRTDAGIESSQVRSVFLLTDIQGKP